MISKVALLIIVVTSVTAVICSKRIVREDLEMAATKGKRHISPVHLQHYSGSLQFHRPSVLFDGDHHGESDKGGYVVISHEKGKKKGHKIKGHGIKGKGSYGKPKGKGGSYGKAKGKGGSYSKGKGGGYGSKTKGGSYGNGKGGIPYYYSGGSHGSSNDGGGSSESNGKGSILYGSPYGSVDYGTGYNSYGISQVGYSSYGSSNGGSSYENSGQGSHGGKGESDNDGQKENLYVDGVVEDSVTGGESSDEKQSEVSADGGYESGSIGETNGKKRSTSPISETDEALADSGDVGSSRRGRTIYNVAINTKKGNAFTENGNNTVRIDFKPTGTGENAFSVSVHFLSSEKETTTLPESAQGGIGDGAKSKSLGETSLGGKRSVSSHSKEAKAPNNEKEVAKVNVGSNSTNTGSSNSTSSGTKSNDNKRVNGTTILKGENRSNRTTTPNLTKSTTSRDREKNGTGCVSGCFSIPPVGLPSLSSESSGKVSPSQIVSSSVSPGNVGKNNKISENSDKERVSNKESTKTSDNVPIALTIITTEKSPSGQNNNGRKRSPGSTGNNTRHAATRQKPMLLNSIQANQTSVRVETAAPLINRTRHVPRYPPALALTSPRFRPTSKPLMDHVDGNDKQNKTSLNPFHESSVPLGDQIKSDQQISGNVAQKSVRYLPRYNPIGTTVRYLPRYNPINPTVATHILSTDAASLIVGNEESPLIRIPNLDDKGKRSTAGKEGSDPISDPPTAVPYLPVDTYYIPLRRLTRRYKKHIAT